MTQTVTGAVAKRDRSDQLVNWIRRQQDDIAMAAASHIKPAAIVRVTQGALRRDDKLLAAAIANPQSLLYALLDCARLGHEPDTDDYYLVPFGSEVTGIEGYKGIIERMFRAGGVTSVVAQVVRQRDRYAPRGENTPPLHEYDDFASAEERGAMRGAYAYAIFTSGHCSQVIRMGRAEIMEHKAASRGSNRSDSPWQVWEPAMWKKTVLRGLEPYVPTSNEFRTAPAPGRYADPYVITGQETADVSGGSFPAGEIVEAEIVDEPPSSNGAARQDEPEASPRSTPRRKTAAAGDHTRSQRADRDQTPRPAADENGTDPDSAAAGAAPSRVEQPLPPLPGENEPPDPTPAPGATRTTRQEPPAPAADEPRPARVTSGQLAMLGQRLGKLGVDDENRLPTLEKLAGRDLKEPGDLTQDEATHIRGLLDRCNGDRGALVELLATGQLPEAEKAAETDG
jgi:recombination protein RecT